MAQELYCTQGGSPVVMQPAVSGSPTQSSVQAPVAMSNSHMSRVSSSSPSRHPANMTNLLPGTSVMLCPYRPAREITERPVGSQHSCRPTVKFHMLPLVWSFTLGKGWYGGAGGSSWNLRWPVPGVPGNREARPGNREARPGNRGSPVIQNDRSAPLLCVRFCFLKHRMQRTQTRDDLVFRCADPSLAPSRCRTWPASALLG